jgi:hypothetical protein
VDSLVNVLNLLAIRKECTFFGILAIRKGCTFWNIGYKEEIYFLEYWL